MIIFGFCSNGFKLWFLIGKYGNKCLNGFDINKVYSIKLIFKKFSMFSIWVCNI